MKVLLDHHMKKQGVLLWATTDSVSKTESVYCFKTDSATFRNDV